MAGEEAVVIHLIEKKIVRKFKDQCATDARQAMTLDSLGVKNRHIVKRLIKKNLLIGVSNDRYYLDEEAAECYFKKKRIQIFVAFITAIIVAALAIALKK